jgi:hypothetical protein
VDSICEKHVYELQHAGEASLPDFWPWNGVI